MHRSAFLLACLVPACLSLAGRASAAEGNDNCSGTITSLPATISEQGVWCLAGHLATSLASGTAIAVEANNVTIDCNGFAIRNTSAGSTQADGIHAMGRNNITVRNCDFHGFEVGIQLDDPATAGHVVEDNQVEASKLTGISVQGDASVVRGNRVLLVGGSPMGDTQPIEGISTRGAVDILDNMVSGMAPGNGGAIGIHAWQSPAARVSGNSVRDLRRNGSTGPLYGIYSEASGPVAIAGNTVAASSHEGSIGLACDTAHVLDNVVVGFVTGQFGCQDQGGNVYAP